MILNTYAILVAFVAGLRLLLGLLVIRLAVAAWLGSARGANAEARDAAQDRVYLLFLLTLLLLALNLAAWPLLYLLLQSYVPEWPGVMCIYGVTQIGKGTLGPARFLPDLLRLLQLTKPALVFGGGAWFVLYLLNRRTETGPLLNRLVVVLLPLGMLAATDAAADLAYVGIPKKEEFRQSGCCLAGPEADAGRFLPPSLVGEADRPRVSAAYYAVNGAMVFALLLATRRPGWAPGSLGLGGLAIGGLATFAVSGLFLEEVAAPTLLGLPYHHCPYDLIPRAPGAVVAVALFAAGGFFLGWACLARWLGRGPETRPFLAGSVRRLLWLSLLGYAGSLAMLALAMARTTTGPGS